jgi:hypothetical protein
VLRLALPRWQAVAAAPASTIPAAGYKPELTMKQLDDHNARLLHCESLIRNTVERNPKLLWWWRRSALGSVAYEAHHRYSRGTDDNFDWTSQANELRKARDSIYDRLIALGVIKVTQK